MEGGGGVVDGAEGQAPPNLGGNYQQALCALQ